MATITVSQDDIYPIIVVCQLGDGSEFLVNVDRNGYIYYPKLYECTPDMARVVAEALLTAARLASD